MDVRQLFKNLKKEAECPLCLDTPKEPKTLPCLHSFCLVCLDKLANFARRQLQTTVNCPVCLTSFQIPEEDTFAGLPASFHLNRLVDILALGDASAEAQTCSSCEEKNIATCYCFDCQDFFCEPCLRFHNKMKLSRGHRNVLIQNLQAQDVEELIHRPVMCTEKFHEKEQLEYYCEECKVCICHKCGLVKHDRHAKADIQQAAEEQKTQMIDVLEKVKAKVVVCDKDIKRLSELFEKSKEEIVAAQIKVRATVEELVGILREHETAMTTRLDEIYKAQQEAHAAQRKNSEMFVAQLRSSMEHGKAIMQRNIGPEILQAQHSVIGRCEELLNTEKIYTSKLPLVSYVTHERNVENIRLVVPGHVIASYTDPSRSVAEGEGLREAQVGRDVRVTIETKDAKGKRFYCEEDRVSVKIQSPTGDELGKKIEDSKNGKYAVTYTPKCVGQHDVWITVNGQPLPGSPWSVQVTRHQYEAVFTFGSHGKGQGQFDGPDDIAVSKRTGHIAVADRFNKRIQMFSPEGEYLREFGQEGPGAERLSVPDSVAFNKYGDVIVSHGSALQPKTISVFDESGQFIKHISSENWYLKNLSRVSVGRNGQWVACDNGDKTIKVLSPDGTELLQCFSAPSCDFFPSFAVHHQDKFFVSYYWAHCVKVFNSKGSFLYDIGSQASGDGRLNLPVGLAFDKFNNLIVCDINNSQLQVFTPDGKFVTTIDGQLTGLEAPRSVVVSKDGHVFVTDGRKHCVHVFQ